MLQIDILSIFPKIFDSYFQESIIKTAQQKKILNIKVHNFRDYSADKHKTVDQKPYGGGTGMVLMAEPILKNVAWIIKNKKSTKRKIIILSARGKQFTQSQAIKLSKYDNLILISGRYEGIDDRVRKILKAEEISLGPYVLMDGDCAIMTIISAVTRLLPGAIKAEALKNESHSDVFLKEHPQYTRPEIIVWKNKKYRVPKVLLSGNHVKIKDWQKKMSKIV